jgi:hypothetical protein
LHSVSGEHSRSFGGTAVASKVWLSYSSSAQITLAFLQMTSMMVISVRSVSVRSATALAKKVRWEAVKR